MLAKRIIPCLDVRDGVVVKGIGFKQHRVIGDILTLAEYYSAAGADELVFYDITASAENRTVSTQWVEKVAAKLSIPFCVAGGIRDVKSAQNILRSGADKVSINTPALHNPDLIGKIADLFGRQCVVVGVDSMRDDHGQYWVWQATGSEKTASQTRRKTLQWISELESLGAGEIVLNCMNSDGQKTGYDIAQLTAARAISRLPLIASGGAGSYEDFIQLFSQVNVDGALAASVFHQKTCQIAQLKEMLIAKNIAIRPVDH
ncbi:MAG: imidazole glycerol phosphate synthase subunit HisF [Proteobacteria bacterium]|nr:imidazole glycerol phosphate synthase subunit HisF [Pseudomonadota bacterium]